MSNFKQIVRLIGQGLLLSWKFHAFKDIVVWGHMEFILEIISTDGEARWALYYQMCTKKPESCKPRE